MRHALALTLLVAVSVRAAEPAPADPVEKIRGLADRWESGTLTPAEKDDLLRSVITQMLRAGTLEKTAPAPASPAAPSAEHHANKVIAVYADRNTTQLVIEARQPLVAGTLVYAGPEELQVTLDDLMARSGDLYYYSASTPGRARIRENDVVVTGRSRKITTPSALQLKIQETYTFEAKRVGEVTAVQNGRAMIDRGTLHEVRERDLYRIHTASGAYRGLLEIKGIGDLQSSGVLYNRLEDRLKGVLHTAPGDRVLFIGQRKLFALGIQGGAPLASKSTIGTHENAYGGGLAWDIMFKDGWGFEVLFGAYNRTLTAAGGLTGVYPGNTEVVEATEWNISYITPFLIKKNFFFPAVVSPYMGVGGAIFKGKLLNTRTFYIPLIGPRRQVWADSATTVVPSLAAGIEAFPARFIRPRLEVRWFGGPTLAAGSEKLYTDIFYASLGCFTAW